MRRWCVVILALSFWQTALAQQLSDSYYRENPSWLEAELWASEGDYYLQQPLSAPFEHFALYGFSFVDYELRGGATAYGLTTFLGRIDVRNPLDLYPDYGLISLLRRVPAQRELSYSLSHSSHLTSLRSESFLASPLDVEEASRLRVQLSSRSYRLGVGYSLARREGDEWGYSLAVGGRWGRDGNIEGLFSDEEYLWLSGEWRKEVSEGLQSSLQVAFMVAPTERSQRSWNTEEVFALAGTPHYNSYWGWQSGKVRSSRLRREVMPTLYASWSLKDRYILSEVNLSALVRGGRKSRSTLDWVEAPNPTPDHYSYLPSGLADPLVALEAERVWHEGDQRYTQIDWQGLYRSNSLSTDGSHYLVMEERSDRLSAVVDLSAGLLGMEGGRFGVKGAWNGSQEYNTPVDLLGGERVAEGYDLYDYTLSHRSWALYMTLYGSHEWGRLSAALEYGGEKVGYRSATTLRHKEGKYYNNLRARACWDNQLGQRVSLGAVGSYLLSAPYYAWQYGATEGAMTPNPYAEHSVGSLSGELWGRWSGERVSAMVTLYGTLTTRESTVEHFWDDLTDQYVALLAGDMERVHAGVELSVEATLTESLLLGGYSSLGTYRYVGDGRGDIVAFESGERVASATTLRTKGLRASSTPSSVAALTLKYFTPRGWMIGAEWAVAGGRCVTPSLLFHSDYLMGRVTIPEEREQLSSQKSLGTATNLNLFAYRRFGAWTLSLSVRNVANNSAPFRAGYQPSRVIVGESDYANSYRPQGARYQHLYPRHAYLSVAYEF